MPIKNSNPLIVPNLRDHAHKRTIIMITVFLTALVVAGVAYGIIKNGMDKKNAILRQQFNAEQAQAIQQSEAWKSLSTTTVAPLTNDEKNAIQALIAANASTDIGSVDPEAVKQLQDEYQKIMDAEFKAWKKQNNK